MSIILGVGGYAKVVAGNCHFAPGVIFSGALRSWAGSHNGTGTMIIQNFSIDHYSVVAASSVAYINVSSEVTFKQVH